MTCLKCNTPTHYDCLSLEFRASLRPLYAVASDPDRDGLEVKKLNVHTRRFRCQDCIKCQNCDCDQTSLLAQNSLTKRHQKWSKDFKLCAKCNKMRDKRLFCPVCERFQPSETSAEEKAKQIESAQEAVKGVTSINKTQSMMAIGQ